MYTKRKKLSNEIIMGKSTKNTAMELDGEGAANFEQLHDLFRKECDKHDRKYARLEDKCNKLEQQVTEKDQKRMSQRGRPSNNKGTGASKKNKSNKRQATTQPSTRQRSTPANNPGQQNRRNSENPGFQVKKRNKPLSPSHNKSTRNPCNTTGKEKPPRTQQRKN